MSQEAIVQQPATEKPLPQLAEPSAPLPPLGNRTYQLLANDYPAQEKRMFRITAIIEPKTTAADSQEFSQMRGVQSALTDFIGVAEISNIQMHFYPQGPNQVLSVCLHGNPDFTKPPALEDLILESSFQQLYSGVNGTGTYTLSFDSQVNYSMQISGTNLTAPPVRIAYQIVNGSESRRLGVALTFELIKRGTYFHKSASLFRTGGTSGNTVASSSRT